MVVVKCRAGNVHSDGNGNCNSNPNRGERRGGEGISAIQVQLTDEYCSSKRGKYCFMRGVRGRIKLRRPEAAIPPFPSNINISRIGRKYVHAVGG